MRGLLGLVLVGCGQAPEVTWHGGVEDVVQARCAGCHTEGGPAPMALDSYEATVRFAGAVRASVEAGTMPPWQPAPDCNSYRGDLSLRPDEKELLLAFLDGEMLEGDPGEAPALEVEVEVVPPVRPDVVLQLPEPYTPAREPDDYRCQVMVWPLDRPAYLTGLSVEPDEVQVVHHTIVFKAPASTLADWQALDAAEDGPGYTCFGGPGGTGFGSMSPEQVSMLMDAMQTGEVPEGAAGEVPQWLGAWVPGFAANQFPPGTGLRMEPGDVIIVQMHYNTLSSDPVPDQSRVLFQVDNEVERLAWVAPWTDVGWVSGLPFLGQGPMAIPAGEAHVAHATEQPPTSMLFGPAREALGLGADDALIVHAAGLHMHMLGTSGGMSVQHADGGETCLLDIPAWDFSWQSAYGLTEPVRVGPQDTLELRCAWDNSAENQPVVDGAPLSPTDVAWGEGSTDEMCLGILYVTGE